MLFTEMNTRHDTVPKAISRHIYNFSCKSWWFAAKDCSRRICI